MWLYTHNLQTVHRVQAYGEGDSGGVYILRIGLTMDKKQQPKHVAAL